MSTLVIINPYAGSGRAGKLWSQLEPLLRQHFPDLTAAVTPKPEAVLASVQQATADDCDTVIAIGGDGTSNVVVDALMQVQEQTAPDRRFTFGQIPVGTGQDFARMLDIPTEPEAAVAWLASARSAPMDVGYLRYDQQVRYFLNIASAGISGEVDRRVNASAKRRPWTFWLASMQSMLRYQPRWMHIRLDGQDWFEGQSWMVAVANGSRFGRGMIIAPDARIDDGLFDVVLIDHASRLKTMRSFNLIYTGDHIHQDFVQVGQAATVEINTRHDEILQLDIDGEYACGRSLLFQLHAGKLNILRGR